MRLCAQVLINLMWFSINRDLGNPSMATHVDNLFGSRAWREQEFLTMRGKAREEAFLEFFRAQLEARYVVPFRIRYDPEDRTGGSRTKYYLLHASNNVKAVLLMKEVMWPLGDEAGTFDYSGKSQGVLISATPTEQELRQILLRQFQGQELGFDELRERTWHCPLSKGTIER